MITERGVDLKGNRHWTTIVAPTNFPVTVLEVKEFNRIDGNDEDTILQTFIETVVELIENYLGRALITRTILLTMDSWNLREVELPFPPLVSVDSIETIDEDNVITVFDPVNYFIVTESIPGRLVIKKNSNLPVNTNRDYAGYRITYKAGYGINSTFIPKQIKIAIMQWVTMIYENRNMGENDLNIKQDSDYNIPKEIPMEVIKILRPFRIIRI